MDLHNLVVNKESMVTPHGWSYRLHDKRGGDCLCTSLSFVAAEPVVLHVDGFGFVLDDGVIYKSNCGGVITLDGRFGIRTTHLDKGMTKLDHGFGADEEASNLGFGAEDITNLIIWATVITGPFLVGTGVSSEIMM